MRVKSLEINGFKSFTDKVVFGFEPGVTAIVGPNGCGKSNVVDAFRWGMGEQSPRRLRGKGMEDVIFTGSEQRASVGMAEVVISFDNSDGSAPPAYASFSEIQVARRLYRSGESEYLINKVPCRLKDILDFFRDTGIGTRGYAIVEQGRIAEIVSVKPEERRILIEEAAGISKYKARRHEAERKLEVTGQNLLRIGDVLGEIRRQISSLERQARKAALYKRVREQQCLLELSLARDERDGLLKEIETTQRSVAHLSDRLTAAETRLVEKEAVIERHRLELAEREQTVMSQSERLYQLRNQIKEYEGQINYGRRERASLADSVEARTQERIQFQEKVQELKESLALQEDELRAASSSVVLDKRAMASAEEELQDATANLRSLELEREECNSALVNQLTLIARHEDRVGVLDERRAEMDARLRNVDEQVEVQHSEAERVGAARSVLEEGLRNLLQDRDELGARLSQAIERERKSEEMQRDSVELLREVRERREKCRARLASMRELIERRDDLGGAARHLLGQDSSKRHQQGLRGLLRDVIEVEQGFEIAVEAAMAGAAEALVVDGPGGAISSLEALHDASAGRGVFITNCSKPGLSEPKAVTVGESLRNHVKVASGFEEMIDDLLSGVYWIEDLSEVVSKYGQDGSPCTFVTRTGDVMTPNGVIRGGGIGSELGILARAGEVRQLDEEVSSLEEHVKERERANAEAEREHVSASDEVDNLRNRHHTAALAVANHEKDLDLSRDRLKAIAEVQEGRVAERSTLLTELEGSEKEGEELKDRLQTARQERAECQAASDAVGLRIGTAGREVARLSEVVTERRVQKAGHEELHGRIEESLTRTRATVDETQDWISKRDDEISDGTSRRENLAKQIEKTEHDLALLLSKEEEARNQAEAKRESFEKSATIVRDLEDEIRKERIGVADERGEVQKAELLVTEESLRLTHLEDQIRDRWHVELSSWVPPVAGRDNQTDFKDMSNDELEKDNAQREAEANAELVLLDSSVRKQKLEETRRKIENMGEVNLGAIEEHEELRERNRFLSEQKEDLEHTVAQLRDGISRINRVSRKRFRETFEAVNERFQKNFPRLFHGGKASLALSESEDLLEAGIEIMAQPPGKKLQSINLLSGGEKTMTAIALLVSVFQVKPSPFFLLDEVDAALDDANIGRFNDILVDLAKDSQFLLITHNKRTIEVADILYGITMEERGVSKLVSVELH